MFCFLFKGSSSTSFFFLRFFFFFFAVDPFFFLFKVFFKSATTLPLFYILAPQPQIMWNSKLPGQGLNSPPKGPVTGLLRKSPLLTSKSPRQQPLCHLLSFSVRISDVTCHFPLCFLVVFFLLSLPAKTISFSWALHRNNIHYSTQRGSAGSL